MADPPLTGALLVGGASQRFGSPKALVRFRGETLLDRGRRLLAEACDEVLLVGKSSDAWARSLAIVDDGVDSRAPVHGVLAALRAARHDRCVVVPVDCPLITPGAVRALGDAVAVAPEGPLPGAYASEHRAVLVERVAAGRLSLRGVNPRVADLPAELFVDVDTPAALAALAQPGHVVVVGGTGMLAGLARALDARGHAVTVFSRRGIPVAPAIASVAVDYRDATRLDDALAVARAERGPIELAVCWIHADAPAAPAIVARHLRPGGRLEQVFGTTVWPLAEVPAHIAYRQVLLGASGGDWLTHHAIASGVLAAVDADVPVRVVGERS